MQLVFLPFIGQAAVTILQPAATPADRGPVSAKVHRSPFIIDSVIAHCSLLSVVLLLLLLLLSSQLVIPAVVWALPAAATSMNAVAVPVRMVLPVSMDSIVSHAPAKVRCVLRLCCVVDDSALTNDDAVHAVYTDCRRILRYYLCYQHQRMCNQQWWL